MFDAGAGPGVVSAQLGHTPEVSLRHYRKAKAKRIEEVMEGAGIGVRPGGNVVSLNVLERGTVSYDFSGLPYEVTLLNVPVQRCPKCGEDAVSVPHPDTLHRVLGLHVVERHERLVGAEVRFLRKLQDWTGKQTAEVFGVDPKTVEEPAQPPV